MLRSKSFTVFLLAAILLCTASLSHGGAIPQLINYQGTLTDTSGTPVANGNYDVVFNIYDVASGGTALWTETWNSGTSQITVVGGVFNAMLGVHTPIPLLFFSDHATTYLGIKVGTDSEMLPRQQITSVGYSFTAGNGVPKGGIIMWSGAVNQIPDGWTLCDGSNGTPDLRDRFVVGAGSGYSVGATGGEATHILTVNEMPSHTHIQNAHSHGITDPGHSHTVAIQMVGNDTSGTTEASKNGSTPTSVNTTGISIQNATATNQSTGGGQAHNNMPPYYALAFIMKL